MRFTYFKDELKHLHRRVGTCICNVAALVAVWPDIICEAVTLFCASVS